MRPIEIYFHTSMLKNDGSSRNRLITCNNLQSILFSLNQNNFEENLTIIASSIYQSHEFIASFSHNVLLGIDYYPMKIPLIIDFLENLINNSFPDLYLLLFKEIINAKLTNSRLFFLYKSVEKNLIPEEVIADYLNSFDSFSWFAPFVAKNRNEQFQLFLNKKDENLFLLNIEEMRENNWSKHRKLASEGVNHNEIAEVIRRDDVEKLKTYDKNILLMVMPSSPFESIDILRNGCTPLHYASFYNSIKCYQYLLQIKSNPFKTDCNGYHAIHFAVSNNSTAIIEHLMTMNNHKEYENLLLAGIYHSVLYHQNDLFHNFIHSSKNKPELSSLFLIATKSFNLPIILLCIDQNIDINTCNSSGETALIIAATNWHNELVRYFLTLSLINVNQTDIFGRNALICAIDKNNVEIVKLLIQDGRTDLKSCDVSFNFLPKGIQYNKLFMEILCCILLFEITMLRS